MTSAEQSTLTGERTRASKPGPARNARTGRRWGAEITRAWREGVLGRLDRRRIIFRWDPSAVSGQATVGDSLRVDRLTSLPATIAKEADPDGQPLTWYQHFFTQGATLWTALEKGRALGSLWIIGAPRVGEWYAPLEPNARVIYGVVTPKWARGRGVAAQLALAAARGANGAPVYLDCMAWNRAAHRAFAKAGFVPVATVGSRWREVRAGPDA